MDRKLKFRGRELPIGRGAVLPAVAGGVLAFVVLGLMVFDFGPALSRYLRMKRM